MIRSLLIWTRVSPAKPTARDKEKVSTPHGRKSQGLASCSRNVRFRDGSVVDICGRGTVLFAINNERHRELSSVYWIPRLKSSIVSIGQLDELGYPTHVEK